MSPEQLLSRMVKAGVTDKDGNMTLERIRSAQAPHLAEARERHRKADLRERGRETVHAQIITLAA